MKIKAFLILAFVLLAPVSTSLSAEEKITGAFGVKLGQTLSSQMIGTPELAFTYESDGTYSFYPDKKFRSFLTYTIWITPKTRKIYSISARGDMDDYSACEKEQALIMALLTKKYEEKDLFSFSDYPITAVMEKEMTEPKKIYGGIDQSSAYGGRAGGYDQTISQGNRIVSTRCSRKRRALVDSGAARSTLSLFSALQKNVETLSDSPVLEIRYLDSKLEALAANERIALRDERIALERSKAIKRFIMFILSIIFFAISAIICWRVDREKCKSLKTYLAKILIGVTAFSGSIACLVQIRDEEVIKFVLSIMFFTIGAIICWRVDRKKCKSLKTYLAKILIGVAAFSVSIACLIETGEEELIKFILSIMFFTIGAIICWRVDREKCKSLEAYLAKILIGVIAFSISIASVIRLIMAL